MRLRDEIAVPADTPVFKARPFNPKIFEKKPEAKPVEKKEATQFETFTLSGSNSSLAKKTLAEYMS
jgi:hypothetical protein